MRHTIYSRHVTQERLHTLRTHEIHKINEMIGNMKHFHRGKLILLKYTKQKLWHMKYLEHTKLKTDKTYNMWVSQVKHVIQTCTIKPRQHLKHVNDGHT